MTPMRTTLTFLSLLCVHCTLALGAAGCSLTHDKFSCQILNTQCVDFEDAKLAVRTSLEVLCRGLTGNFNTSACDRTNAVGGCKKVESQYTQIQWYYPTDTIKTINDVASRCSSGDAVLNPDGTIHMGGAPDLSVPDQALPDLTSHD